MSTNISSFALDCFDRQLMEASAAFPLDNDATATAFVSGFVACFCLRTFSEIEKSAFDYLCGRGCANLGIE